MTKENVKKPKNGEKSSVYGGTRNKRPERKKNHVTKKGPLCPLPKEKKTKHQPGATKRIGRGRKQKKGSVWVVHRHEIDITYSSKMRKGAAKEKKKANFFAGRGEWSPSLAKKEKS